MLLAVLSNIAPILTYARLISPSALDLLVAFSVGCDELEVHTPWYIVYLLYILNCKQFSVHYRDKRFILRK